MKRLIFLLMFLTLTLAMAWADCSYTGNFSIKGKLGANINFQIDAQYWGDDPCLVVGQTTYFRKNGSESHIKVYGTIGEVEGGTYCELYEFANNRVCGHFSINNMPDLGELSNMQTIEDMAIEGNWENNGIAYEFEDVKLNEYADVDYDFLRHTGTELYRQSGAYQFVKGKKTADRNGDIERNLVLMVTPDSVMWKFGYNNEELGEAGEWEDATKGYGRQEGIIEPWKKFEVNGGKYGLITMDDVVMVYCYEGESEDILDIEGIYPKIADISLAYKQKQMKKNDPKAISYSSIQLITPRTDNSRLNDSIRAWVGKYLDVPVESDYFKMAAASAEKFFTTEEMNDGTYEDEENWRMPNEETMIQCDAVDEKKYLNMVCKGSSYYGGAHGMYAETVETLRRSDGKVMRWKDWFADPSKVRSIVEKYMREQNDDVVFDSDRLELPADNPFLQDGKLVFCYQHYEATAYAYGMPNCHIPVNVLLPYMTTAAKNLVK